MNLESLTKAAQCAQLLTSDIQQAHAATCADNSSPAEKLLGEVLLPMIAEACVMEGKPKRLLRISSPSAPE